MKLFRLHLIAVALLLLNGASPAPAVAQISQGVRVCDPSYPSRCIKPNADGSLNTSAVGGGTTVTATAAAPTYVEGSTSNPLSVDLSGNLRVVGAGGGGSGYTLANGATYANTGSYSNTPAGGLVTTAAPTYTNGQASPLNLTTGGALRVLDSGVVTALGSPLQAGGNIGTVTAVTAISNALPAGSNSIGAVTAASNSAGAISIVQADASAAINVSTATTTQLVALSSGKKIYVTSLDVIAGGTGNITFVYGTGTACGTGTTSLTGAYNLTAQAGIAKGNGLGPVLVVPASNALCVTTSAAVQMSGSVAYAQF